MTTSRHIRRKHTDLAVGDLARRAGILSRDPAECLALLQEAGLIDNQHALRSGYQLSKMIRQRTVPYGKLTNAFDRHGYMVARSELKTNNSGNVASGDDTDPGVISLELEF